MIAITGLDHVVLTVASLERTLAFYRDVLGMRAAEFEEGHWALHFGDQKFNLHEAGHEFEPRAARPVPGSADLCLVTSTPLAEVVTVLTGHGVPLVDGPGPQAGARGAMHSVYVRDPDENLIEIAFYGHGRV
ncbi:VOC family protein [Actinoplanes sp. NPDC051494]|uniref:VOC family protein n=1 Tax=Actinoplanes sp. NPDC051494 TaxID=3363907 RepID=UPI00379CB312